MKRIAIADPAMSTLTGHNRELNLARASEYVSRGYQVDIYANKKYPLIAGDQGIDGIRIIPHFTSSPYNSNRAEKEMLGADGYLQAQAQSFAEELQLTGDQCPLLLPSIYPYLICGVALLNWKFPVHGVIHRQPDYLNYGPSEHWQHAFKMAQALSKPLGVHVLEPVLQGLYAKYAEGKVRIRLAPNPLRPVAKTSVARQENCIALLGGLRAEQGLKHVPAVVNSLVARGFTVLIQDAGKKLEVEPHPAIKIIGFVEDFRKELQSCSALLLNYDPASYATSTSGVAWEALVTGTPVLYSRGIASADTFRKYNCGIAFDYGSTSQITAAAIRLQASYATQLALARAAAKKVQLVHNVGKFVDHLAAAGFVS